MADPFVVIGGDAAGLSAASKCKREAPERDVIVFERGKWVSYAHCGMPYYVKGEVAELTDLLSLSPAAIEERGIDLRRGHEVVAVDPERETVRVDAGSERFDQSYGDLLVATGARAVTEPIDGTERDGVFTMHHMDSAAALRAHLEDGITDPSLDGAPVDEAFVERYAGATPPETVAIVGGGYVGVEMAEAFVARGLDVHLFQRSERVLPPFGESVGEAVGDRLRERGVSLHLSTEVNRIEGEEWVESIVAGDGSVSVDAALVGVGIAPNTAPVEETPVELGASGAIAIDDYGRTTVDGIYAAGDCAEMPHAVTGERDWVPLGLTANRAGRAVGATVAGDRTPVGDVAGTAVVKAFELECGRVGLLGERASEAGFDPVTETITAGSRSGYYPGGSETTVTLTVDRETERVLGGAIVGEDRAAIRIDTLATAIEAGMSVGELERADLAYAPPFSPVWDPVLVAAKVVNGRIGP